jgi:MFS family permease
MRALPIGAVVVLALGALDFGLEQSLVIPALPALAEHYDASLTGISWLVTGFLLSGIVAVPLCGRLGDLYGKRLLLLVSLAAFFVGSLLCALTHSIEVAIAGRAIQGIGFAVGPLTLGLARDTLPPGLLTRAIGAVIGAAGAGAALGFLLSGVLSDHLSPAAIFWFLVLTSGVLVVAVATLVQETAVRARAALDLTGAFLLGTGLFSLVLAISQGNRWHWTSARIIGLFAVSAVLLALFVLVERRATQPLVDLGLIAKRPFANANACAFALGYSFFIAVFVIPLLAAAPVESGYGQGLSTTQIGVLLAPTSVGCLVGGWIGGRVVDVVGSRALIAMGSLIGIGAYGSLALAHGSWAELSIPTAALGVSVGFILTGVYPVVIRNSEVEKTGVAVAVTADVRNMAVTVGAQVAYAILIGAGLVGPFVAEEGFTRVFVMGGIGAGIALLTAGFMPGRAATPS